MTSIARTDKTWTLATPIERGESGTLRTLRLMAGFCRRDAASTPLRAIAHQIIRQVRGHDFRAEIDALFRFTRDQIIYRRDPVEVERVQDALRTIEFGSGDCDDKVTLLVSLLAVCGHRARFVVTGPKAGKWLHVYCEVRTNDGRWLPLDPTPERASAGWEQSAPAKGVFEIWPHISANIRLINAPVRAQRPARPRRQANGVSPTNLNQYLQACEISGICEDCALELAGFGLGADKYEWKYNAGAGKCTLEKKKCGVFCKIGRGFKKVGKLALAIAPLALAPFTAGGSMALTGATGTALTIGATAASAANQLISTRYTSGLPQGADIQEPTGQCLQLLQQEAAEEARKQQEALQAQQQAQQQAQEKSTKKTRGASGRKNAGESSPMSNPIFLGALVLGGLMVLNKR